MGLFRIGPFHDQLRSGVMLNGLVEFLLHLREEQTGRLGRLIEIQRSSIDVGDLLVEPVLRHPDLPDLFQQAVEIFFREYVAAVLQTVAVHGPVLDRIILDDNVVPLAELNRPVAVDLETHGDDGLQIVEVRVILFPI